VRGFLPLLSAIALITAACRPGAPVISAIEPRIGMMGEVISILGSHFGDGEEESFVTIGGTPPTQSSYIEWTDSLIRVRVPEFGEAGLVYVHRGNQKSNPALFSNLAAMPEPVLMTPEGAEPRINALEPASGPIGSLITIRGSNFGSSRGTGGVFFAWDAKIPSNAPREAYGPETMEAGGIESPYDQWSDHEIRVRVPDGAASGNLTVKTPRGHSRPVFFDVSGKPGSKTFQDKRNYTFTYGVDIQVNDAAPPNSLYLWIPRPLGSSSQREIRLLSQNLDPFIENYRGSSLFQLVDLSPTQGQRISLSWAVDVWAVETNIRAQSVRQDPQSPVYALYTIPDPLIPSGDGGIKKQAEAIVGRERNPYLKAQRIYEFLLREKVQAEPLPGGALEGLEEKRLDSYRAALLFCALARAAGVPAIPVAGVLVDRSRNAVRHYWAEFWIDNFGWVPLDIALGAGAAPSLFNLRENHRSWYFGNMDSQRITFSRGLRSLSLMAPRGRAALRPREYALQNYWEEAVGGLESYSSLWSDVTITGIYAE